MSIELDLEPDTSRIADLRIDQPFVAVEPSPATEGECCRDPAPRLLETRGDRLDEGFTKRLGLVFGGALGCSHLLTLYQLMASTVPRAMALETERVVRESTAQRPGARFFRRSLFVDGFERDADTNDVVVQLADTHTRPIAEGSPVVTRLVSSHELKLRASIERKRFRIASLEARERHRTPDALAGIPWQDHDALVAELVDRPIIPGLAGRIFGLLREAPDRALLRDALLQLAPGYIQITAAQMDEYYERRARAESRDGIEAPAVSSLGGNTNSCWMWREGSPVARTFASGRAGPSGD
ncbi:MAG: hypothetical protein R3E53_12610 [Myxococcota bacterium]